MYSYFLPPSHLEMSSSDIRATLHIVILIINELLNCWELTNFTYSFLFLLITSTATITIITTITTTGIEMPATIPPVRSEDEVFSLVDVDKEGRRGVEREQSMPLQSSAESGEPPPGNSTTKYIQTELL